MSGSQKSGKSIAEKGPHTSTEILGFLSFQNIDLISHSSYSPDLSPKDFLLFPFLKNKLRDQRYSAFEETVNACRMHILETPQ